MDRFLHLCFSFFHCRFKTVLIAAAWVAGLLFGSLVSLKADTILASTMHGAVSGSVSIFGLLSVLFLPLLVSALAVFISQPLLLVPVVFLKAFSFSYTAAGLFMVYPTAGWLLQALMMFSDMLMMPAYWLLWLRAASGDRCTALRWSAVCAACAALIGCVDYTVVAPFLAHLISI